MSCNMRKDVFQVRYQHFSDEKSTLSVAMLNGVMSHVISLPNHNFTGKGENDCRKFMIIHEKMLPTEGWNPQPSDH